MRGLSKQLRAMSSLLSRALLALLVAAACPASAQTPLAKPPSTPPPAGQRGFMMVGERALAFVPKQATPATPVPLLILFHGAGGNAQNMMKPFLLEADKRGFAMLAVQSRGPTWDLVKAYNAQVSQEATLVAQRDRLPAGDRRIVDSAIALLRKSVPIDASRVGAFGFSDGAAYALTYGAASAGSVGWVGAVAPGFALIERGARSKGQRLYIAHGRDDKKIAIAMSQSDVCPKFAKLGWTVRYEGFAGGHEIPAEIALKMLGDWLDPAARPALGSADYRCGGSGSASR